MKKVGQTSAGSVLVEMTRAQFEAMTKLLQPMLNKEPEKEKPGAESSPNAAAAMVLRSRMESIRTCLGKMKPQSKKELVRAIRFVCQHSGGIRDRDIEQIIKSLQEEKFLTLDDAGKVDYSPGKNDVSKELDEKENHPALMVEEAGIA